LAGKLELAKAMSGKKSRAIAVMSFTSFLKVIS